MDYLAQDTSNCSVGRAVALVGQPWVLLILREVTMGVRRFSDMRSHLGVSRSVLSDRLDSLVANGVLELGEYREPGQRARSEYRLTQKGRDLYPAITALREWGDKYLADPDGPPLVVTHRGCGARIHTALVCEEGHTVTADELDRRPGASARTRVAV